MSTPDNYIVGSIGLSVQDRSKLLMQRMRDVIEGSELIRKECNRIRNELLTLGVAPDIELTGLLAHLQYDIVALRVKYGYLTGLKGDELIALLNQLANPAVRSSNEDPS